MQSNDHEQAGRETLARQTLLDRGADGLDRRPWQPAPIPPSAVDLIQFFLWKGDEKEAALAALQLLPAARAEIDQLETGLLFAARGLGLTWAQMAQALGLNSPQASQQRLDRLLSRTDKPTEEQPPADGGPGGARS
ncbi:hypothetical protein [Kribbella sp. NPDC051770]|uniref:hypothetical protein n=1 Tax=Kribbella sp. NPDC051770 TaxID=3155413 RepID=UPI00341E27C4